MSLIADIARGARRAAHAGGGLALGKVVFVSYGPFDCNSAGHIAGFAGELSGLGYRVAVAARGPVDKAWAFGEPAFEPFELETLASDPLAVVGFDGDVDPARTILIAWTPRKNVRRAVGRAIKRVPAPYVVHLEDNEAHLSDIRPTTDDTAERDAFLAGAAGVTMIVPRLAETLPSATTGLLLEPGVDHEAFGSPLPPWRRRTLLRAARAEPGSAVIVYAGNIHRANAGEMGELYRAIGLLRARGRPVVLLKTGKDDAPAAGFEAGALAGVISLGQVERPFLIELLKCADLFVQPGGPGPFNDFRLPSKIPEFMAVGRPIVLPAANVGLLLRHGMEAMLLREGSADEIAGHVQGVLADPALAARLAAGAQAFARKRYQWRRQGRRLAAFLERVHRAARART